MVPWSREMRTKRLLQLRPCLESPGRSVRLQKMKALPSRGGWKAGQGKGCGAITLPSPQPVTSGMASSRGTLGLGLGQVHNDCVTYTGAVGAQSEWRRADVRGVFFLILAFEMHVSGEMVTKIKIRNKFWTTEKNISQQPLWSVILYLIGQSVTQQTWHDLWLSHL